MTCGFRQARECLCPAETCSAAKPATPTPTHQASVKTIMLTALTLGVVFIWFGFVALSEADRKFGEQDLRNQEVTLHDAR